MTSNLYSFNKSAKTYYELSKKSSMDGDYFSSLTYIRKAINEDESEPLYKLELAKLYSDIEMYDKSKQLLFELLSDSQLVAESYFNLAKNAVKSNKISEFAYFMRHYSSIDKEGTILANDEFFDDYIIPIDEQDFLELETIEEDDDIESIFGGILSHAQKPKFKIVGGKEDRKEFYKKLFNEMGSLVKKGKFDEAIKIAEEGQVEKEDGVRCQNALALCYYFSNDFDKAIEISNNALKKFPQDSVTLSNLVIFYAAKNDIENKNLLIERINKLNITDINLFYKLGLSFMDIRDYKNAIYFFNKLEKSLPYDNEIIMLLSIAYYNLEKYETALDYVFKGLTLMPRNIDLMFIRTRARISRETRNCKQIDFKNVIPNKTLERYLKSIEKDEDFIKAITWQDEFLESVFWYVIELGNNSLSCICVDRMFMFYKQYKEDILKISKTVLCSDLTDTVKKIVIKNLLSTNEITIFHINNAGLLNKIYYIPLAKKEFNEFWNDVYIDAFSLMSVLTINFEEKIVATLKEVSRRMKPYARTLNTEVLSALVIYKSSIEKDFRDKKFLTKVFNITIKEFNYALKLYKEQK